VVAGHFADRQSNCTTPVHASSGPLADGTSLTVLAQTECHAGSSMGCHRTSPIVRRRNSVAADLYGHGFTRPTVRHWQQSEGTPSLHLRRSETFLWSMDRGLLLVGLGCYGLTVVWPARLMLRIGGLRDHRPYTLGPTLCRQ